MNKLLYFVECTANYDVVLLYHKKNVKDKFSLS